MHRPTLDSPSTGSRRSRLFPLLAAGLLGGCVVYADDDDDVIVHDHPPAANYAPVVTWADGGCYWDGYYHDHIWWFEADIDDPNSPYDVVAVYADVYDSYSGGWVDSFELYPTNDAYYWFSDWLGSSTWLDCSYGGYVVDIVAYDALEASGVGTFYPATEGW